MFSIKTCEFCMLFSDFFFLYHGKYILMKYCCNFLIVAFESYSKLKNQLKSILIINGFD